MHYVQDKILFVSMTCEVGFVAYNTAIVAQAGIQADMLQDTHIHKTNRHTHTHALPHSLKVFYLKFIVSNNQVLA